MKITKGLIIICAVSSLLLMSCKKDKEIIESIFESFNSEPVIEEDRLVIHTDIQRAYLNDKVENVNLYARGVEELSRPISPTFSFEGEGNEFIIHLSEKEDYSNPFIYSVNECKVTFTNLKIDTTYYYKVINGEQIIKEDTFTTSDEIIRNLYVSGVTNVRDLGGYRIGETKTKQGIIYRTGKLNKDGVSEVTDLINEKGIKTMLNDFKVKSEIDLRGVSNNEVGGLSEGTGVLGETVKYYQCPMNFSDSLDTEENLSAIRKVFSILGDKTNYPTFFHCSIGTDRTGYVAFLINAYLGVEEENLYRDYLFSNFGNIGGKRTIDGIKNKYVNDIKGYPGETLKDKVQNYLLGKGVSQTHLDVLSEMMIEK